MSSLSCAQRPRTAQGISSAQVAAAVHAHSAFPTNLSIPVHESLGLPRPPGRDDGHMVKLYVNPNFGKFSNVQTMLTTVSGRGSKLGRAALLPNTVVVSRKNFASQEKPYSLRSSIYTRPVCLFDTFCPPPLTRISYLLLYLLFNNITSQLWAWTIIPISRHIHTDIVTGANQNLGSVSPYACSFSHHYLYCTHKTKEVIDLFYIFVTESTKNLDQSYKIQLSKVEI